MKKFKPLPLVHETLIKLRSRSRLLTYEKIEEDTGLKPDWLKKFGQGKIVDPSYSKLKVLSDYLNSN